jgi:tRNA(fMet)-specific endonuclease VapC
MKYLLDTCTISNLLKNKGNVMHKTIKHKPEMLAISTLSIMELEYGFMLKNTKYAKEHGNFRNVLKQMNVLPFSQKTSEIAAKLRADLRAVGTPIGHYDLLIAATALEYDLRCVTSNTGEFQRVEGLVLEDWY